MARFRVTPLYWGTWPEESSLGPHDRGRHQPDLLPRELVPRPEGELPAGCARPDHRMGIDRALGSGPEPGHALVVRWWRWISDIALHWNWGYSPVGEAVNGEIAFRIGVSAQLVLLSMILSTTIGIALATYTAARQYRFADRFTPTLSLIALNIPVPVASLAVVLVRHRAQPVVGQHAVLRRGLQLPRVHRVLAAGHGPAAAPGPADRGPDDRSVTPAITCCNARCCWMRSTPTTYGWPGPRG